jgi:hypothetical protein
MSEEQFIAMSRMMQEASGCLMDKALKILLDDNN